MSDQSENLDELTDEEQVALLEQTDNGPRSDEDAEETAKLPQSPGSEVG
jgi:hypothetical protein